jgi:hypothetical protein
MSMIERMHGFISALGPRDQFLPCTTRRLSSSATSYFPIIRCKLYEGVGGSWEGAETIISMPFYTKNYVSTFPTNNLFKLNYPSLDLALRLTYFLLKIIT